MGTRPRSRTERLVDATSTRLFHLPPERGSYSVTPAIRVRMRDGVHLLTDHYAPDGPALGTVVMRGPYQRAGAVPHILLGLFASRGYHVVMQSCRGTFGSEGRFVPGEDEIRDGADTVEWLREQPWFEGRFVGVGGSYLSYTLWSMLMEPPPEMVAAVSFVSFHDFFGVVHGSTGAFTLNDILDWCDSLAIQEDATMLRQLVDGRRIRRRRTAAYLGLPVSEGEERFLGAGSAWFRDWATRTDRDDPYWQVRDLSAALDRVSVPVRFLTGWQDLFLGQTIGQYRRLRDRGVEVSLTVGPWTHAEPAHQGRLTGVRRDPPMGRPPPRGPDRNGRERTGLLPPHRCRRVAVGCGLALRRRFTTRSSSRPGACSPTASRPPRRAPSASPTTRAIRRRRSAAGCSPWTPGTGRTPTSRGGPTSWCSPATR